MDDATGPSSSASSGAAPDQPDPSPWYRSAWALLASALAVAVGILLVVVVRFDGSDPTSATCAPRDIAHKTVPSVVTILVESGGPSSNGSGEFIDTDGHVLTNNHVISSAAESGTITVLRPSGERLRASLVGRDNATDLAVLKVETDTEIVPIEFGEAPDVGDQAFAIGAPLGLADTFTAGVVSALGRSVRVPADHGTTALLTSAIQTDATINPGNSGGTLANCAGELIGVPTAGSTASDSAGQPVTGSIGLGFAIPADFAKRIADELIANGAVAHGEFGMSVVPVSRTGDGTTPDGLYVASVAPGGAAALGGLREGDIITSLDSTDVTSADQLQAITLTKGPGDEVEVGYLRDGNESTATVTLSTSTFAVPQG